TAVSIAARQPTTSRSAPISSAAALITASKIRRPADQRRREIPGGALPGDFHFGLISLFAPKASCPRSVLTQRSAESVAPWPVSRWLGYLFALDLFRITAARTSAFNASWFILSPSWKSIARLVFPSRLELKRLEGSFRAAPLAKVIFTTFL